jgi:hypothetical protein
VAIEANHKGGNEIEFSSHQEGRVGFAGYATLIRRGSDSANMDAIVGIHGVEIGEKKISA